MVWIAMMMMGCGSGSLTIDGRPQPQAQPQPLPSLVPIVEEPTPFRCEPRTEGPVLQPDWVVAVNDYGVVPGNFAFSADGSTVELLAYGWPQSEVVIHTGSGELLVQRDAEVRGFARSNGISAHVDLQSRLVVDGVVVASDLELTGANLRVNDRWIVLSDSVSVLRAFDLTTHSFTELAIDAGWNSIHELALDGDALWVLRPGESTLERFDLRTASQQTFSLNTVDDVWPAVAGLTHGPQGLVYTTLDGTRTLLDAQASKLDSWDGGFRMVNDQIYAQPWVAAPVAWSPRGRMRAELGSDGEVVLYQACNNDRLHTLTSAGLELLEDPDFIGWGGGPDWTPPIGGLIWSPDGGMLAVRLEGGVAVYQVPVL